MRFGDLLATALAVVMVGCSSPTIEEGSAESTSSIIGGTRSTAAADYVVRLDIGYNEICTGTLLTPNLVITARHCVSDMNTYSECGTFTRTYQPSAIGVSVGVNAVRAARVTQIYIDNSNVGCSHDIALLRLDTELTQAPATIRFTKVVYGEAATTMGYGEDASGRLTNGRFEKAGLTIESVGPSTPSYKTRNGRSISYSVASGEVSTGESTCFGDSGGPLFDAAGSLIGLTTRGIDNACIDRPTIFTDLNSHENLIRTAAQDTGHALVEPTTAPPTPAAAANGQQPVSGDTNNQTSDDTPDNDAGTTTGKKKASADATPNNGCASAPGSGGAFGALLLAFAVASLRRARGLSPSPRSSARSPSRGAATPRRERGCR